MHITTNMIAYVTIAHDVPDELRSLLLIVFAIIVVRWLLNQHHAALNYILMVAFIILCILTLGSIGAPGSL
jgi:hypothetical protein